MDVVSWSAWTGNLIALVGIGYTWWANRGTREVAAAAGARADKSLAAAQEAAAAQQRMADVLEKMYEAQERRATADPGPQAARPPEPPDAVPWLLERVGDGVHRLTNAGPVALHDVHVTASDAVGLQPPALPPDGQWPPGESVLLHTAVSWQAGTPQLVVTWHDAVPGEQRRWERVIPR